MNHDKDHICSNNVCIYYRHSLCSGRYSQTRKATRLTAKFQSQGAPVVFKAVGKNKNIIQISQKNIVQEPPLTKGQITTLLGVYLKENTQADLKKLGFTSGIIVDGKSRRYDFHL